MKRHALLIGYTAFDSEEETLENVVQDLENYEAFLKSSKGGAWYNSEITTLNNVSKSLLDIYIKNIIQDKPEIVFTVFSGHGYYDANERCRKLLINRNEEILSRDLIGLANKQILICDSCSKVYPLPEKLTKAKLLLESKQDTKYSLDIARKKYDEELLKCDEQTICLYAAKIGTSAQDINGGVYTNALLKTLKGANKYMSIVDAHNECKDIVRLETLDRNGKYQEPEIQYTRARKFLPGAIYV